MIQKNIATNNIYLLTYGFQYTSDDKTQIETYRKDGSKVKFLYKEDDKFFYCKTGEEVQVNTLPGTNPVKLDVVIDKNDLANIYTEEELKTRYVHTKGVIRKVNFKITKEGGNKDPKVSRFKLLLPNILPINEKNIFELTSFSYVRYLKILIQNALPVELLGKLEDKCNKMITNSHEARAKACKNKQTTKTISTPRNNTPRIEMDGHVK